MVHFTLGARALSLALQQNSSVSGGTLCSSSSPCNDGGLALHDSNQAGAWPACTAADATATVTPRFCLASQPHTFHTHPPSAHTSDPTRGILIATVPAWSWSRGQYSRQGLPFASLSFPMGGSHGNTSGQRRAVPLFSLANALGGPANGGSSELGSSEGEEQGQGPPPGAMAGGGGGPMGSGSEEDSSSETPTGSELEDSEVEALQGVHCSGCHRPLLSRAIGELRVCDGCHRCFHGGCCRGGMFSRSHTSGSKDRKGGEADGGKDSAESVAGGEGDGGAVGKAEGGKLAGAKAGAGDVRSVKGKGHASAAEGSQGEQEEEDDDGEQEEWFHAPQCKRVHRGLEQLCGQGEMELPQGRSLQLLLPDEAMDPHSSNHRSFEHLVAVLGEAYGPYVYRHVEGSDYGVLLRSKQAAAEAAVAAAASGEQGSLTKMVSEQDAKLLASGPAASGCVSAATVDVYGTDLAKLDLLVTREEAQQQGHGKALVAGLENMLSGLGIAALVVVLDKSDQQDNKEVWPRLFKGYRRLNGRQVGALRDTFPHFQAYDRRETVFLRRNLPDTRPKEARDKAAEKEKRAKKTGQKDGHQGKGGWVGGLWHRMSKSLSGGRW